MAFIQDSDRTTIKNLLAEIPSEVTLHYFTQEIEDDLCRETRELLEELCSIEDKIKLQIYDFKENSAEVEKYKVDKIPATVIANGGDSGIRFYGIPAGYEFASLLEAIVMVSEGESNLSPESKKLLKDINVPVHIQVFVTPT
jgi:glutaredoxin-like protein